MGFVDLTGRRSFVAAGNAELVDEPGSPSGRVLRFDGSGDWIQSTEGLADFPLGLGDFCVEISVRVHRYNVVLVDFFRSLEAGWQLWIPTSGVVQWWRGNSSYLDGSAIPLHEFCTLAADRRAGVLRLFVDGVEVASSADVFDYTYELNIFALGAQVAQRNSAYDLQGDIAWARVTRASRYAGGYTPPPSEPPMGAEDALWASTVLFLSLEDKNPTQRTTIDSMTADTAPGGDWTTYDGSAGRVVSGSISAALADGQSVTVSFDGGATWATATASGLSWSIIDPGEHVTSWIIVARVSAGSQSGPVTVRSVSLVPPPAEIENPYPPLVTSEHAVRPRFMATVEALTRPLVRAQSLIAAMPAAFDLDAAEGVQLDAVGLWVGRSRYLSIPISGAWFSFDTSGLGFDEGTWKGPFDATTGISRLDDGPYRLLLKARIAANQWDGTRQGAVDAWSVMFDGTGVTFQIQDNGDMSMDVLVSTDHPLDAVTTALITGGYLGIKPSGVTINSYTITEV